MSLKLQGSYIAKVHTVFASTAFLSALILGLRLHYRKIVKNEVAGYPEEWWPSVSATIGDWYPERSIFHILIALTAGPRIALVFCWWWITRSTSSKIPHIVAFSGLARTLACGGWVYITSSDDHEAHDILMVSYMIFNLPWMIGSIFCTPVANIAARKRRKLVASSFFLAIIPMVYLFIQHKVHRVPGAYTKYSFCEWYLIFSDIWFDSITASDFTILDITISDSSKKLGARGKMSETTNITSTPVAAPTKEISRVSPTRTPMSPRSSPSRPPYQQIFLSESFRFLRSRRIVVTFLADVYLAYVWWSIFTSLAVSLFYFSVWQLAIAGQEITLISTLSPVFLAFPSFRYALESHKVRTWLHVFSLIGLAAYKLEDPLLRLFAVSFANITGALLKALEWSDQQQAERYGLVLALGLALSSLSKFMNDSNNPIWPIVNEQSGGWNKTGILLALLSIWEYATRDLSEITLETEKAAPSPPEKHATLRTEKANLPPAVEAQRVSIWDHWLLSSISLGALIFSLHCFLADSGTLVAWTWTGYPVKGPMPGYHGHLTLMAIAIGITIAGSTIANFIHHPFWMIFGTLSTIMLYKWRDWPGYMGGFFLAIFLSSVIPGILQNTAKHGKDSPGKVYFTAWLTVCLFDLANIWTVAYAFVPAGWLLRERTDIVMTTQLVGISLGLIPGWRRKPLASKIATPSSHFRRHTRRLSVLIILISFLFSGYRFPLKIPSPHNAPRGLITAGIWTVHFGIDDAGRDSQRRMRDLIQDMHLDVVGLLETDLHRVVFGNRDLTQVLARDLGYHVDIGPGPNSHTWGAVLLSKFPILTSTHHLLPSPHGELAPAISAVLDVWGQNVTVVVSHNGQEEDALDRELQSTELARIMAATYPDPVIFLGYVVSKPLAERPNPYEILVADGKMHDIDDQDWDRWCEYILYRGLYRVSYARVSRSTITDTELQVGKFLLPRLGSPIVNASRDDRYLRTYREELPSSLWFPDEYLGNVNEGGVRGHFYHVHPWPLYYRLPQDAVV